MWNYELALANVIIDQPHLPFVVWPPILKMLAEEQHGTSMVTKLPTCSKEEKSDFDQEILHKFI